MTEKKPDFFCECSFFNIPEGFSDILTAELSSIGFDGFEEAVTCLKAYIPEKGLNEVAIAEILNRYEPLKECTWNMGKLQDKNWNAIWEKEYQPVLIAGKCLIRAPFHPPRQGVVYDLVIEPKMSFGTAHHATTSLMIGQLLQTNVHGKVVLDMGCGTGVLAILSALKGASDVVAVDNDEWAFENAKENTKRNNCPAIVVIHGGIEKVPDRSFDLILANINRNVLMDHMPEYCRLLSPTGELFVSGFYEDDLPGIQQKAEESGIRFLTAERNNNWVVAKFIR